MMRRVERSRMKNIFVRNKKWRYTLMSAFIPSLRSTLSNKLCKMNMLSLMYSENKLYQNWMNHGCMQVIICHFYPTGFFFTVELLLKQWGNNGIWLIYTCIHTHFNVYVKISICKRSSFELLLKTSSHFFTVMVFVSEYHHRHVFPDNPFIFGVKYRKEPLTVFLLLGRHIILRYGML